MARFLLAAASASLLLASAASASVTNFETGNDGWGVFFSNEEGLGDFPLAEGGNPGANLQFRMIDTFGVTLRNDSNAAVLGDLSRYGSGLTLGLDLKVNSIQYAPFGMEPYEVARHMVVELVDYTTPTTSGLPYTSVWYDLGEISLAQTGDWTRLSISIDDVNATALPAGWGGYGDETPLGEPFLPADRTFASVLAHVDELRFTTYVPGYVYGFTRYDLQYDNITVAVPEPTTLAAMSMMTLLTRRRRA